MKYCPTSTDVLILKPAFALAAAFTILGALFVTVILKLVLTVFYESLTSTTIVYVPTSFNPLEVVDCASKVNGGVPTENIPPGIGRAAPPLNE